MGMEAPPLFPPLMIMEAYIYYGGVSIHLDPDIYNKQGILQWAGSMNNKYILGTKVAKFIE